MLELAAKLIKDIDAIRERTSQLNPQTVYSTFKADLTKAARDRAKVKIPQMQKRIDNLRTDRDDILAIIASQRRQARLRDGDDDTKSLERRAGE